MKYLKYILGISFGLICFLCGQKLFAVSAYPYPIVYSQPNGDTLTLIMGGDEFVKYARTLDEYTLLQDNSGYFCYAQRNLDGDIEPSVYRAKSLNQRSFSELIFLQNTKKNLSFSQNQLTLFNQIKNATKGGEQTKGFPTTGNRKLLCILMNFKNKAFVKTRAQFDNLFNQIKYNQDGATGSVKDYFLECSYGQFNLTVDVVGPYTASQNMVYYGGNDANGRDVRPHELAKEAVQLASRDVNYATYDNDNDGNVDGVYIIFAGFGEEAGGGADAIWSHASTISPLTYNGKRISSYSCSPELRGNTGTNITGIGVICHEFGHILGAMDYYDTDYDVGGRYDGTGNWDLMASGNWNNNGRTPAHPNPRIKIENYKWAKSIELKNTGETISIPPATDSASFYRINTATANEYFLLENRQQKKFDSYIPGHGLMIYRCHSGIASRESSNRINSTHPQHFYPVARNATLTLPTGEGKYGTINHSTCPWPGTGSGAKTNFTDATTPSMKSWASVNSGKPITDITESSSGVITFKFMGGSIIPPKVNTLDVTAITETSATLNGSFLAGTEDIIKKGFEWQTVTAPSAWTAIHVTGANLTHSLTNLSQGTQYAVRAFVITAKDTTYGNVVSFKTLSSNEQQILLPNSFSTCASSDKLVVYYYPDNKGYLSGYNAYGATKYAQKYNLSAAAPIAGVRILMKKEYSGTAAANLNVNLYGIAANGTPLTTNPLATKQFSTNDIPETWAYKDFYFNTPISTKDFFVSVDIPSYSSTSTDILIATTLGGCASGEKSFTFGNYYGKGNNWYTLKQLMVDAYKGAVPPDLDLIILPIQGTPPKVTTENVTAITQNSATLKGTVTAGTEAITSRGFEYKLSTDASWTPVNATGTTSITYNLSGLIPATSYHVRAFAATSRGKTYGNTVTFNTLNLAKEAYLYPNSFGTCATVNNVQFYTFPNSNAFITGTNPYNSIKYAQKYHLNLNTKIVGVRVYIFNHYSGDVENLKIEMFSVGNNGAPHTVLASKNYSTSEISDTAKWENFYFKTPVTAKDFLLSVEVPDYTQSSSEIVIGTSQMGCYSSSNSYVYRNLVWNSLSDMDNDLDLFILPIVEEVKPSGVITDNATEVAANSAKLNGTITDNGTYKIIGKGFEWRFGTRVEDVPVTSDLFSFVLSDLGINKIYSFRAYVITPSGKTYGETVEFKTTNSTNLVNEINPEKQILIYPNPAHESLTVNGGELNIETLEITDVLGKCVIKHKSVTDSPVSIDVSSLKSGIYIITIQTDRGKVVGKFVKE